MKDFVSIQRLNSETHLGLCYTSKMKRFAKIVNYRKALKFFVKHSM